MAGNRPTSIFDTCGGRDRLLNEPSHLLPGRHTQTRVPSPDWILGRMVARGCGFSSSGPTPHPDLPHITFTESGPQAKSQILEKMTHRTRGGTCTFTNPISCINGGLSGNGSYAPEPAPRRCRHRKPNNRHGLIPNVCLALDGGLILPCRGQ